MLAWKDKVADRLARLLADSSPIPASTAVEPQVPRFVPSLALTRTYAHHIVSDLSYISSSIWVGWDLVVN